MEGRNGDTSPESVPPTKIKDLRKISGLKDFSKIFGNMIIADMTKSRVVSQFGNEKGVSVNHYLIKKINEILCAVDKNSVREAFELNNVPKSGKSPQLSRMFWTFLNLGKIGNLGPPRT